MTNKRSELTGDKLPCADTVPSPEDVTAGESGQLLRKAQVQQAERERQSDELRRTQEELEASQARYFDLYEFAPIGYCTVTGQGTILQVNLTAANLLGRTRDTLLKQPFSRFILDADHGVFNVHFRQLFETGAPQAWEIRMVRGNGTTLWAHLVATSVQNDKCRVTISDITKRKRSEAALLESEERLRMAQEAALSGTWEWDLRTNENIWSENLWILCGLEPFSCEATYDTWLQIVHPDDRAGAEQAVQEATSKKLELNTEWRVRYADGSDHWLMSRGKPLLDENGQVARYLGIVIDITERKRVETALHEAHGTLERLVMERTVELSGAVASLQREGLERKQLELQLIEAKKLEVIGQIAGGVAHEVRNPLNAILTITEALFRESVVAENPEFGPYLQHIRAQINRLAHLTNDLLDLGRTVQEGNRQPVSLLEVCREALDLWKSSGLSKTRAGGLSPNSVDASVLVLADGFKLEQAIFNLLENAGDHIPDGSSIIIQVMCSEDNCTDGMAVVQVIDRGTGIAEESLPHVFNPFYTRRKGGTGLGLALVRRYIGNMGGTVQIWNNDPPPGCTVEVRIPLYRENTGK